MEKTLTVYELIQMLAQYPPHKEVDFYVEADFTADGEVEFDRDDGRIVQDVEMDVTLSDYVVLDYKDGIEEFEDSIRINLVY